MPDRRDEIRAAMALADNYQGVLAEYELTIRPRRSGQAHSLPPGGFAIAFLLYKKSIGISDLHIFRFYHRPLTGRWSDTVNRLSQISSFINEHKRELPYFLDFQLHEDLLKLGANESIPGIHMKVAPGNSIKNIIIDLRNKYATDHSAVDKSFFAKAAKNFRQMGQVFHKLGMAHGDLSNDNVFIDPNGNIYLVDYDSVYVPTMGSRYVQTTAGAETFQHPLRLSTPGLKCSAKDDDFSFLVIYLFLLSVAKNPSAILAAFDERCIFKAESLTSSAALAQSEQFKAFSACRDSEIQRVCSLLMAAVDAKSLDNIPCFFAQQAMRTSTSKTQEARFCIACGHKFESPKYKFCTDCGAKRVTF